MRFVEVLSFHCRGWWWGRLLFPWTSHLEISNDQDDGSFTPGYLMSLWLISKFFSLVVLHFQVYTWRFIKTSINQKYDLGLTDSRWIFLLCLHTYCNPIVAPLCTTQKNIRIHGTNYSKLPSSVSVKIHLAQVSLIAKLILYFSALPHLVFTFYKTLNSFFFLVFLHYIITKLNLTWT